MNQEQRFKIVSREAKKHIYIFKGINETVGGDGYIQSALEEFFWGTWDLLKKARGK